MKWDSLAFERGGNANTPAGFAGQGDPEESANLNRAVTIYNTTRPGTQVIL
jgi:hypothetical protein